MTGAGSFNMKKKKDKGNYGKVWLRKVKKKKKHEGTNNTPSHVASGDIS